MLLWTPSPADALAALIHLNDTYALDGQAGPAARPNAVLAAAAPLRCPCPGCCAHMVAPMLCTTVCDGPHVACAQAPPSYGGLLWCMGLFDSAKVCGATSPARCSQAVSWPGASCRRQHTRCHAGCSPRNCSSLRTRAPRFGCDRSQEPDRPVTGKLRMRMIRASKVDVSKYRAAQHALAINALPSSAA